MKSYYEILGVSNNADAVTIKKAYKSLVKQYHPDIYKGVDRDTKFQEIQKAYDVLGDENKRIIYDQNGHQSYEESQKYGNPGAGYRGFDFGQEFGNFKGFNGVGSQYKTINFRDIPLWKRILIIVGFALLAVILFIGFIIVTIVKLIMYIIKEIFK